MFLGMANYLRKFINKLADLTSPLNNLLKNDVCWLWTDFHENIFNNIKKIISAASVLQNYDINLPVATQCDASQEGLGCCLMQNGKPVSYTLRNLTNAARKFAQIEKELLSVVWATKKFQFYFYGKNV